MKSMSFPIDQFFDINKPCITGGEKSEDLKYQLREWSIDHLHYNDTTLKGGYVIPCGFEKVFDYVKITFSDDVKTSAEYGVSLDQIKAEVQDFMDKFLELYEVEESDYKALFVDFLSACDKNPEDEKTINKACNYVLDVIDTQLNVHHEYVTYKESQITFWNSLEKLSRHLKNRAYISLLTSEYVPESKEIILYTEAIHMSEMTGASDFNTAFTAVWAKEVFHAYFHMLLEENKMTWRTDQNFQVVSESLTAWFECEYIKYCLENRTLAENMRENYRKHEPAVWPASAMTGIKHHRDFVKMLEMSINNMNFACVAIISYKYWDELSELNMDLGKMYYKNSDTWDEW